MRISRGIILLLAVTVVGMAAPAYAQLTFDGNVYTKFLWGTDRLASALYAFTTIPGEGLGDSADIVVREAKVRAAASSHLRNRAR